MYFHKSSVVKISAFLIYIVHAFFFPVFKWLTISGAQIQGRELYTVDRVQHLFWWFCRGNISMTVRH